MEGELYDGHGRRLPPGLSKQLANLSHRYPSLQFDDATGAAKLDNDVLFDSGDATAEGRCPGNARKRLAKVMSSPDARDLKLMVVGHTDSLKIARKDVRGSLPRQLPFGLRPRTGRGRMLEEGGRAGTAHRRFRFRRPSADRLQRNGGRSPPQSARRNFRPAAGRSRGGLDGNLAELVLRLANSARKSPSACGLASPCKRPRFGPVHLRRGRFIIANRR